MFNNLNKIEADSFILKIKSKEKIEDLIVGDNNGN